MNCPQAGCWCKDGALNLKHPLQTRNPSSISNSGLTGGGLHADMLTKHNGTVDQTTVKLKPRQLSSKQWAIPEPPKEQPAEDIALKDLGTHLDANSEALLSRDLHI